MSYRSNKPNPLVYLLEQIIEGRWSGLFLTLIILPVLALAVLLLPPISIGERLLSLGYTKIERSGGSLTTPDGMEVNFLPEGLIESFRVKLDAIPRTDFLKGSAGNSLVAAAESIPPT
jgi:hypothetical protein